MIDKSRSISTDTPPGNKRPPSPALDTKKSPKKVRFPKGNPVTKFDRKIWRPQQQNTYRDPPYIPDETDSLEILYRQYGHTIRKENTPLPARTNIVEFDPERDAAELQRNLRIECLNPA